MFRLSFVIFSILLFAGCSTPTPKPAQSRPYWLEDEKILESDLVIGFSKPTFQGLYMQRQSALHDAKEKLSLKLRSTISSTKELSLNSYDKNVSISSIENINEVSNIILKELVQYDAFIDDENNLYLLIGLSNKKLRPSKKSDLQPYNKQKLLASNCYCVDVLNSIDTKSLIYHNKPLWFYEPYIENGYTTVAIAQRSKDFEDQLKYAILLAKADLMKKTRSLTHTEQNLLRVLKHDENAALLESSSIHKSSAKFGDLKIKDMWMDPKSCELYLWSFIKKESIE